MPDAPVPPTPPSPSRRRVREDEDRTGTAAATGGGEGNGGERKRYPAVRSELKGRTPGMPSDMPEKPNRGTNSQRNNYIDWGHSSDPRSDRLLHIQIES